MDQETYFAVYDVLGTFAAIRMAAGVQLYRVNPEKGCKREHESDGEARW